MNHGGRVCAFADAERAACDALNARASGHPVASPRGGLVVADTYAKEHARFGLPRGAAALRRVAPSVETNHWFRPD